MKSTGGSVPVLLELRIRPPDQSFGSDLPIRPPDQTSRPDLLIRSPDQISDKLSSDLPIRSPTSSAQTSRSELRQDSSLTPPQFKAILRKLTYKALPKGGASVLLLDCEPKEIKRPLLSKVNASRCYNRHRRATQSL